MIDNQYHARPSTRSKVNRRALASQRVTAEDRVQRVLLAAIGLTLVGAVAALLAGAQAPVVTWTALGVVLGLAIAYQWRALIVSRWQPWTRPEAGDPSWKPTGRQQP